MGEPNHLLHRHGDTAIPKLKDNVCVCSEPIPAMPKGKWLLDTGCGYDLVPQKLVCNGPVRPIDGDETIMFATANGKIKTYAVAPMFMKNYET